MKKTVLGAAVLMLAACGGEPTPTTPTTVTSASAAPVQSAPVASTSATVAPPPKPPLAELMKKTTAAMIGAWAAHDAKKLAAVYADDAVLSMPGPMGWMDAKKADIETQMGGLFSAFPDSQMTPTRTFAKGNVVVTESVFTGTNTGDFMGQKATGKKVGYHAVMISWFNDDGLVSKEHVYYDHATAMAQMKADPKA
ncbi:MAG TPA: ester cyclase, partial [Polyangiaceae bacterium]